MPRLVSLKVNNLDKNVVKTIQVDVGLQVHDAVTVFFSKFAEITDMQKADVKEYGLFMANLEDPKTGVWLEPGRTLDYYMLGDGDMIFFKRKLRMLKVRTMDGNVKTIQVDDSQTVGNLMVVICTKLSIMNHDEYSLVREDEEEEKKENTKPQFGTLTLRRKKDDKDKDKDAKMEQLKKKLRTDDELNWVDHGKSLREQGIDEHEILLLRRKFFYSDRNIDASDPVQLNLIFVQARDAILNGTHPVTFKEATMFAGIQCQIQFGDHVEHKHKPGFLELQEFLPKSYMKHRNVEKIIFTEHKNHKGLSELEAKARYVHEARALKTYGVAFFLVKEKMTGKNKLVPRLLGITKDSVLRLDEKTKEILKTWPLTTVRRWAASPNTFTLDFGDYADQYYSVQTTEGEQIAQLISGYIDIILKRKAAKDYQGQLGDEGNLVEEDIVSPYKAQIIERPTIRPDPQKVRESSMAKPGIIGGVIEPQTVGMGHMQQAKQSTHTGYAIKGNQPPTANQPHIIQLSEPQTALIQKISGGKSAVEIALKELDEYSPDIPDLGTDPASLQWRQTQLDTKKQTVSSQIAAMNAATAQVVTLTGASPDEVDHTGVGAAISTITTNLPEMTRGVKTIAALTDEDSGTLIDATRTLCSAFSELLVAAEPESKEPRQTLLNAASRIGEASHHVLSTIQEEDDIDREVHDVLLALAKAVANATAALVLKAKSVASKVSDQEWQNRVINAATQCALATSQLVACAKVVAPTIASPACQEQIIEAAKGGGRAVDSVVTVCRESCPDGQLLQELGSAATDVTKALNDLLNHIRGGYRQRAQESVSDGAVDTILVATDRLFASSGDSSEMVRQAKILAQATAQLISAIKMEAEQQSDGDLQKRLLAAAQTLANATSRLVDAAKQCASSPGDSENQLALRKAAESLRSATSVAASAALKKKLIKRLENAAKHAASTATQCIAASQGVGPYNTNISTQEELMQDCREVADCIPRLVEGVKGSASQPDSAACQLQLIDASEIFLHPGQKMVSSAKSALPTVNDQSASLQLSNSSKQFSSALADLRAAMGRAAEACGGQLQIDSALDMIQHLDEELLAFQKAVDAFELKPLPNDPQGEAAAAKLSSTSKTVGANMAGLLTAASQGNESYTGQAARETAASLKDLTKAVRAVAASSQDPQVQRRIIDSAREVMESSISLVLESKQVINNPQSAQNQQRLTQVAKEVSQALNKCVNCLPGQKDVDEAIENISSVTLILNSSEFPPSNKSYGELQSNLNSAAASLNDASNEVVVTAKSPTKLASSSKYFGNAFGDLVGVGMEMAGQTRDTEVRGQMVVSMKNVSVVSSKLLVAAKHVAADPNAPNAKNQLATAARGVTDSINQLINVCTSAAPGQKECDNAIRQIRSLAPLLDQPSEPVNDSSYFQCLDLVMEKSKALGDGMTGIANHAKKSSHEDFGEAVTGVSEAVCGLIEAAAQAAYLLAVSEPSSVAGRPGLVDQSHFSRAASAINSACQQLTGPSATQQQVLSAATVIAKHTSALCNSCRVASSKTSNPVAKRHFVQSAKDVANATASLVNEIKALDLDYSDANRSRCSAATTPLLDAVTSLCAFASSPDFASVPAKISSDARKAQLPITESGKHIIEGSCAMIHAAKSLAVNPKDPPTWQSLANHSKSVSDAIKNLVSSIRDAAPGQKECDDAIELLGSCIRELDQASIDAISQKLTPRNQRTLQGFNEQTRAAAQEILERIDRVKESAEGEAESVGHAVTSMCNYFSPLVVNATGLASHMVSSKQQSMLLDQVKTLAECASQLVYAAKEAGGNPKAYQAHGDLAESTNAMKESGRELMNTLETVATSAGVVYGLLDGLTKAMLRTDDSTVSVGEESFVDYQTRMVNEAKEIAVVAQDMIAKSTSNVSELCTLAGKLRDHYSNLANDCKGCASATSNSEVATRIKTSVQHLGQGCIELVKAAGSLQTSPNDTFCQRELSEAGKTVSERVCTVLAALQSGSRGTQACINAASTVSGIIGDLDTTIMFATAGTLHAETDQDTFADHRENILKTAKALVEDTKTLVAGAASSQEQLAVAAQNAVATIVQLSEVVKFGAASLGSTNTEAQVLLINAVKDVASALGDLIQATKSASGKSQTDPAMLALKDSAKALVLSLPGGPVSVHF